MFCQLLKILMIFYSLFAYFSDPVSVCNVAGSEGLVFMPRDRDHQEY